MAKERMVVIFDNSEWEQKVEELERQGWKVVAKRPMEEVSVEIIGQKLTLERVANG